MNSLYIGFGVTLIVALVAALVGPFFIDWTLFRSTFEAEGGRIFGARVTVLGHIDARLLPSPSVSLGDVVVGPVENPAARIGRFDMRLELTPLLKGEFRIAELRLDRPSLQVTLRRNGTLGLGTGAPGAAAPSERRDLGAASLETAEIVDGRVDLLDERSGRALVLERVNGIVSGASLAGPLKAEGGAEAAGRGFAFRIASGRLGEDGSLPLKLQVTPGAEPILFNADATVQLAGSPRAAGSVTLQRVDVGGKSDRGDTGPTPWRTEAKFTLDPARLGLDELTVTVGPDERAYALTGQGFLDLGVAPRFEVALAAKQVDLDRALAGKVGEAVELDTVFARIGPALAALPVPDLPGRLAVDVPGLVVAGGVVQDLRVVVRPRPGGLTVDELTARLPGRTHVSASGRLALAAEPAFDGRLYVASEQPASFAAWFRKGSTPGRLDPLSLDATVALGAGRLSADQILARIGPAQLRGWFRAGAGATGPRIETGISADRLDLDQILSLAGLVVGPSGAAPAATRLELDAGQVVLGGTTAKGVAARLEVEGERIAIDRLSVQDAAGAAVEVAGRIEGAASRPDGTLEARIEAERLDGLVRLLAAALPGVAGIDRLAAAAPHLSPLKGRLRLTGRAGPERSAVELAVEADAGGSRLAVDGRFDGSPAAWRTGRLGLEARLDGPDGGRLLRQLGVTALSIKGATGRATARLTGVPADGLDAAASLDALGTRLGLEGRARLGADGALGLDGEATLVAADLAPVMLALGQPVAGAAERVPVELRAAVTGTWPRLALKPVEGRLADGPVRGELLVDLGAAPWRLDGRLETGPVELAGLFELGLGPGALGPGGGPAAPWPGEPIGGPVLQGIAADLAVAAERVGLGGERAIERPSFRLRVRPGELAIENFSGALAGGTARGQMRLRRAAGGEVALTGDARLDGVAVEDFVWRREGRAVATGTMDLAASVESAGRSVAALVAGLTGGGAVTLRRGTLRYVNADAFQAIVVAADGGLDLKEDRIRSVFQNHLDAGTLPFERIEAAFGIGGGVVRLREVAVESARAHTTGSAQLDLARWTLEADWTVKVDAGRNAVTGAEPQVGVLFRGPLDAPARSLDVAPLAAFLTLRAFEHEVGRVEALQQDLMERERFARELRRIREERARMEREAREAETRRAEEERRRAEEKRARDAAEAARRAEEDRRARDAAEARRAEEERRARDAEAARRAEEDRRARDAAEARRAEEERRRREEERRRDEERRRADEAARRADEERRRALGPATAPLPPLAPPIQIGPAPPILPAPRPAAPLSILPEPAPIPPAGIGRP